MNKSLTDLVAFQKGQAQAKEIFELTQKFPREELYSLTDQIRRSSRAVCANLGEAYRKRMYEAHFISKVSDADMENTETQVWLKFAFDCHYISEELYNELTSKSQEIGRLLDYYMKHPEKFRRKPPTNP
jgi:four helix bundle protein